MTAETPIQIDDLLSNFGMTRDLLIKKNPKYQDEFVKLDKYYERYKASPSDSILKATNNITMGFFDKLKKENADMFDVEEKEEEPEEVKVVDKFSKYRADMDFYVDEGDQDAMDDLFNLVGEKNTKSLLTYENFKVINKALRSKNELIITHLFDVADRLKFFPDALMGREGDFVKLIFQTKNVSLIKHIFRLAEKNGILQEMIMLNKGEQVIPIFGMKDPELIKITVDAIKDHPYGPFVIQKAREEHKDTMELDEEAVSQIEKVTEKAQPTADKTSVEQLVEMLSAGLIPMETPLVNRLERKFSIKILDSAEEIANGKSDTYRFVVPTSVSQYFDQGSKTLHSDKDYTIYEVKKTDFERHFGASVYELGICWFNMLNLVSIEDVLAIFYVANISTSLMVDRANKKLRAEYLAKIKFVIDNPESNKIAGQYFVMKEANLVSLKKSGFLDEQYCPTKLLYCAIVLHSFPFPAYSHPFEFIEIGEMSSMFQFQTVKGEFGNESFYTDGDVLFHNFTDAAVTKFANALTDVSRTTILNLKSNGRSDVTKQKAVINHFIPFIYSVPKSGVFIPTFQLRVMDIPDRKINWGVYELQNDDDKIYINSYALSSVLINLKQDEYNLMTYKGTLSDTIFASPNEGVIIQHEKTYLAIRGIRGNEFLSANFGKNWENYYKEMFTKEHLNREVLDKLDANMVKAIHTSSNVLISSTETGLQYKTEKKYAPTFQKDVVKPAPQVKRVVTQVAKKDDRVYISLPYAKQNLDRELLPVFEKVQSLRGEQRDEAILDEMWAQGVERIFPRQLLYMGFDLKEYITDKPERVNFKNKYKLTIPILLSFEPTYYLEKI